MNPYLCIYHGNCADGFAAACVVKKWAEEKKYEITFHAGVYQEPPPDVQDKQVILVYFSYKRPVIEKMLETCDNIHLIDHHKSAIDDLADFTHPMFTRFVSLEHSGAMLAWQNLIGTEPPQLLKHIEDRDLWKFKLQGTEAIQMNLFSYPYDFKEWEGFLKMDVEELMRFEAEGEVILRKHFKDIREFSNVSVRWLTLGGVSMPVVNVPYMWGSDAAHLLAKNAVNNCAGYYYDTRDGRIFGLRSVGDRDVQVIAKQYGGGGHTNAAGFKVTPAQAIEIEFDSGHEVLANPEFGGSVQDLPAWQQMALTRMIPF